MRKAILGVFAALLVLSLSMTAQAQLDNTLECTTIGLNTECHTPTIQQVDGGIKMPSGEVVMLAPVQRLSYVDLGDQRNGEPALHQVETSNVLRMFGIDWVVTGIMDAYSYSLNHAEVSAPAVKSMPIIGMTTATVLNAKNITAGTKP